MVRSNFFFVCAAGREPKDREILRYYHRVKFLIDRYRRLLLLGIVSLIATDLAGIALPWLIKGGIDTALRAKEGSAALLTYPLLILGAAALQGFFRYCWRINIHGFSRRCEADLRDVVFAHLQKLPLSYFQYHKIGDLMSRLTNDIHAVRELMGFGSLAIVDAAGGDLFQPDADDRHRPLADLVVDDGDAIDTRGGARISAGLFFAGRARPRIK